MEFFDLKKQYQNLKSEIDTAVLGILQKGIFIGGETVENFEKEVADFLGVKHSISLNSGTDALYLSLKALGIGTGDEVITTPFTFFATAEAIAAVGALPVFVDIDPKTFNIDVAKIEAAINPNTKAIMPVHIFGQMSDMMLIKEIAQKHNLKIIEDCAQAIGATQIINDKKVKAGTIGDTGCFSFFPTKNLGAYGDGGMVSTDSDEIAAKIRLLKVHGSAPKNKYKNLEIGVNSRLDTIQAAILNVKIKYLDKWNLHRAEIAARYNKELGSVEGIVTPFVSPGNNHIYHQYTIKTTNRDNLAQFLIQKNIPTMIYYLIPLHLQSAFNFLNYKIGYFSVTETTTKEILSLPIYPEFTKKDQDYIIQKIKEFYAKKN